MDGYIRGFIMEERAARGLLSPNTSVIFLETKRRRRFSSFPE